MVKSNISVILPVYNAAPYLKKSIDSILNQSYKYFELIIINDGSVDHSEEIILSYSDDRIVYVKNQTNLGVVKSLNCAMKIAKSKYIARMDADDVSFAQRFKTQIDFMETHPEIGVCGSFLEILETKELIKYPECHADIVFELLIRNVIAHPVVMFRRELLENNGLNYDAEFYPAEDYKLWIELTKVTRFYNFQFPLLQYNVHPSSISQSNQSNQLEKAYEIRATYLLETLSLFSDEAFKLMKGVLKFQAIADDGTIESLKTLFISVIEKNKTSNSFNQEKFVHLFRLYWYVAVKQTNVNIVRKIKTYVSLRSIGLFKITFFIKLVLNSVKYEKTTI